MYISPLVTAIEGLGETLDDLATVTVSDPAGSSEEAAKEFTGQQHFAPIYPYTLSSSTTATQENI